MAMHAGQHRQERAEGTHTTTATCRRHWVFLRVLWEEDGLTQRELSVRAGMMEPTTLAALRALETLGFIRRRKRKDNRKNVYVYLTAAGAALKARLVPLAEEVNAIAVRGIAADAIAVTRQTLLAMIGNLVQDEKMLAQEERRLPSTRELARLIEASRHRRAAKASPAPAPPRRAAARAAEERKRAR